MAAHANAVENLLLFAPLVIVAIFMKLDVSMAAAIYFFARLAHAVIYTLGIPLLRTFAFVAGTLANISIAISILSAL